MIYDIKYINELKYKPWYVTSSFASLISQIAMPPIRSVSSITYNYHVVNFRD